MAIDLLSSDNDGDTSSDKEFESENVKATVRYRGYNVHPNKDEIEKKIEDLEEDIARFGGHPVGDGCCCYVISDDSSSIDGSSDSA